MNKNNDENILTRAVLVNLSISQFNPVRQDRKVTSEIIRERDASKNSGKWVKILIDPEELRRRHYDLTLPWMDGGWRILPTEMYFRYHEQVGALRDSFLQEADKFSKSLADENTKGAPCPNK